MLTTHDGPAVIDAKARYWLKIASLPPLWGAHRNIATTFGMEKPWQNYEDMFIRFDRIHERDRHPDGRTDGQTNTAQRHRPRLRIASRLKNRTNILK